MIPVGVVEESGLVAAVAQQSIDRVGGDVAWIGDDENRTLLSTASAVARPRAPEAPVIPIITPPRSVVVTITNKRYCSHAGCEMATWVPWPAPPTPSSPSPCMCSPFWPAPPKAAP